MRINSDANEKSISRLKAFDLYPKKIGLSLRTLRETAFRR